MTITRWAKLFTPAGLVAAWDSYRSLQRLGAPVTWSSVSGFSTVRSARLDLLPDGALAECSIIVDVGANVGDWTEGALLLAPTVRVLAVEANPALAEHLNVRFAARPVTVRCAAVGPERGRVTLNLTDASWGSSVLTPRLADEDPRYRVVESVEVEMLPLDDLTLDLDDISVLKIDVQGFEREVLKGANTTLGKSRFVIMEANFRSHYEGDALFCEVSGLMADHGFVLAGLSQAHAVNGWAMWSDAVFRRR